MGAEWGLGRHSRPSFPHVQDLNGSQLVGRSHSRESSGAEAKGSGIWFFKAPGGRILSNPGPNLETMTLSHSPGLRICWALSAATLWALRL